MAIYLKYYLNWYLYPNLEKHDGNIPTKSLISCSAVVLEVLIKQSQKILLFGAFSF